MSAQASVARPVAPPVLADPLTAFCEAATTLTHGVVQQESIIPPEAEGGVWFTLIGSGGVMTFTTCTGNSTLDFSTADTVITVYSGSCDDLILIARNDDGGDCGNFDKSVATLRWVAGATYYVQVNVRPSNAAIFGIRYEDPAQLIHTATALQLGVVQEGKIAAEPEGVWFSFLGTGGDLAVTTCTGVPELDDQHPLDNGFGFDTDTIIRVYVGNCVALNQVAEDDDDGICQNGKALAIVHSVACQTYYVQVTHYKFDSSIHRGRVFGLVVKEDTVAAPIASPVASCSVVPPVACPIKAPAALPVVLPVVPPVAPPVAPPVSPPVAPPITPLVSPPVAPPVLPPVTPPITHPVAPLVTPHVVSPLAPLVSPPVSPVAPLVSPPVASPVSPPVTPPVASPVSPPVAPPPVAGAPIVNPVDAPIKATVTPPTTGGETQIIPLVIDALLSFFGAVVAVVFCIG